MGSDGSDAQMMMARVAGRHMARIIGYAAMPVMLGPILGPVIAGAILQHTHVLALAIPRTGCINGYGLKRVTVL